MEKKYIDMMNKMDEFGALSINYSTYTKKFYFSTSLQIMLKSKEGYVHGICEHRETPEEAIEAFYNKIVNAESFYVRNTMKKWQMIYKYEDGEFGYIKDEHPLQFDLA